MGRLTALSGPLQFVTERLKIGSVRMPVMAGSSDRDIDQHLEAAKLALRKEHVEAHDDALATARGDAVKPTRHQGGPVDVEKIRDSVMKRLSKARAYLAK